ncbi:general transcription factor II-I repeat domain-containing protein 2A-like [Amblyraja radiata]|uniref:general transcription factor II-I repeat domain-containing protein 2A-like n=1 Tax=Amblyraja radiata TaxID=386614 RepID=UPI001401CEA9|nr:general transcription factor II-I repeat domain-containing protein 2A-like [Amblyraja radiata]
MATKCRKVDVECRIFQDTWTEKYFFIQHFGTPTCLICHSSVSVNKEVNIRRHYETRHPKFNEISGQARKHEVHNLKWGLENQSLMSKKKSVESERNTCASYAVSKLIAENMKPFNDGDFVKECLMAVVDILCPEIKISFSNVSLSERTVARRIEEMSVDVKKSLKDYCQHFQFFSIALDESTDTKNTAQLAVFVRGVNSAFDTVEELVQLVPMKGTTTGADILEALLKCTTDMELDLSKLVCVATDGAPAMVGEKKGVVALLQNHMEGLGINHKIEKMHCLIHQEALCAKSSNLKDVMDVVVRAVNMILSQGLNHRQFQQLLSEAEAQYGDLLYFCDVRWLNRGAMLERVYALREEIATFLEGKNVNASEFRDPKWLSNLAFLVDLTAHFNNFNLQLQGRNQLVHEMCGHIVVFETKLHLWECQLEKSCYAHFPKLKETQPTDTNTFVTVIRDLKTEFSSRFADIRSHTSEFRLFATPFDMDIDNVPENVQMELIEMQCSDVLRSKFKATDISLPEFYKKYLLETGMYTNLVDHAKKMTSMFGSTYMCEQLFSKMKYTKSKLRNRLTDAHLDGILYLASSSLSPNIERLSSEEQHQVSH